MTRILFIKQRIRRGPAVESSIEDFIEKAFRETDGIAFESYDLGEMIRRAEDGVQQGASPEVYQKTRLVETEKCLRYVKENDHHNVLLLNGYLLNIFNPGFYAALSKCTKKIAAWELDDPYYIDLALPFLEHLDVLFTVETSTVPLYRRYGKTTEWLPLACEPTVQKPLESVDDKYHSDVCFIGVPFRNSRRVRVIDEMAKDLAGLKARIIGATNQDNWHQALGNYNLIAHQIMEAFIPVDEAVNYYNGAAINLNLHKDSYGHAWDHNSHRIIAQSPCERTFSIAGCGGFQLIDATRPDLAQLFKAGRDIIDFSSTSDLAGKIHYYLQHENERLDIAQNTLDIVLKKHTYKQRVQRILEVAFSQHE